MNANEGGTLGGSIEGGSWGIHDGSETKKEHLSLACVVSPKPLLCRCLSNFLHIYIYIYMYL